MSLISASNSRTPAIAGALDFNVDMVENGARETGLGERADNREYGKVTLVCLAPLKHRVKDLCRDRRFTDRWRVLNEEDMTAFRLIKPTVFDQSSRSSWDVRSAQFPSGSIVSPHASEVVRRTSAATKPPTPLTL